MTPCGSLIVCKSEMGLKNNGVLPEKNVKLLLDVKKNKVMRNLVWDWILVVGRFGIEYQPRLGYVRSNARLNCKRIVDVECQ